MPVTYNKIASVTVGSGGAVSMDFNSIPATYDDLILKLSGRFNNDPFGAAWGDALLQINGSTASLSSRLLVGNGSSAVSASSSDFTIRINSSATTANTFTNIEIMFPNYRSSTNKSFSMDLAIENNATTARNELSAGLRSNTAAITSLSIVGQFSSNFVQHSTAVLYGISRT